MAIKRRKPQKRKMANGVSKKHPAKTKKYARVLR